MKRSSFIKALFGAPLAVLAVSKLDLKEKEDENLPLSHNRDNKNFILEAGSDMDFRWTKETGAITLVMDAAHDRVRLSNSSTGSNKIISFKG